MSFGFENHTIGLSDKNRSKVKSMKFDRIVLMSDLETAAARLMCASSIMAVPLSSYYFALKFLRRKLGEVNRETLRRDENLNVPESVLRSLRSWQHDVLANTCRLIPREEGRTSYTLWTDASNLGWGAVLVGTTTVEPIPREGVSHYSIIQYTCQSSGPTSMPKRKRSASALRRSYWPLIKSGGLLPLPSRAPVCLWRGFFRTWRMRAKISSPRSPPQVAAGAASATQVEARFSENRY